jgi:hypothetical protein
MSNVLGSLVGSRHFATLVAGSLLLFPPLAIHVFVLVVAQVISATVRHLILEVEGVVRSVGKATRDIVLMHGHLVVLLMTHWAMRTIVVMLLLLVHLHIVESLVALRTVDHIIMTLIRILKHVGPLRYDRVQG